MTEYAVNRRFIVSIVIANSGGRRVTCGHRVAPTAAMALKAANRNLGRDFVPGSVCIEGEFDQFDPSYLVEAYR